MRAERDAFAERLRHVETATLQQDTSAVEELQVLVQLKWNSGRPQRKSCTECARRFRLWSQQPA